jgi:hypothetical protein
MDTVIDIPNTYSVKTDNRGNSKIQHEPTPSQAVKAIIDHVVACEDFTELYSYYEPCSLSENITCSCGWKWRISDRYLRNSEANKLQVLLMEIKRGMFTDQNSSLMKVVWGQRAKTLKSRIERQMTKIKVMQVGVQKQKVLEEEEKVRERMKRFRNPISSLEIE